VHGGRQGTIGEDLLARVVPVAIVVDIDPRVQHAGGVADGDCRSGIGVARQERPDGDAVIAVVCVGAGGGVPVAVGLHHRAEYRAAEGVVSAVVAQPRRVCPGEVPARVGGVTEVRGCEALAFVWYRVAVVVDPVAADLGRVRADSRVVRVAVCAVRGTVAVAVGTDGREAEVAVRLVEKAR